MVSFLLNSICSFNDICGSSFLMQLKNLTITLTNKKVTMRSLYHITASTSINLTHLLHRLAYDWRMA